MNATNSSFSMRASSNGPVSAFAALKAVAPAGPSVSPQPSPSPSKASKHGLTPPANIVDSRKGSPSRGKNAFDAIAVKARGTRLGTKRVEEISEDSIRVEFSEGQSIIAVGLFNLWIKVGEVSIFGASLQASPVVYQIFASTTRALPRIEAIGGVTELLISSIRGGETFFEDICLPDIERISGGLLSSLRTFFVLGYSLKYDEELQRRLAILDASPWEDTVVSLVEKQQDRGARNLPPSVSGNSRILICGPKSNGKSTFTRYLVNRMLMSRDPASREPLYPDGVALLDFDLMQPELGPPGNAYLAHVRSPLLGARSCHSHFSDSKTNKLLRMHYLGQIASEPGSESQDCAVDLYGHYQALQESCTKIPLVINIPAWFISTQFAATNVSFFGLPLTDVVYFQWRSASALEETNHVGAEGVREWLIPSKIYQGNSASLDTTIAIQAYFHTSYIQNSSPIWKDIPLKLRDTLKLSYNGSERVIWAVYFLGHKVALETVCDALDGSVVGVMVLKTEAAVKGLGDAVSGRRGMSYILATEQESIPCLITENYSRMPFDRRQSECLGLAYVIGIDPVEEMVEILTPIPAESIRAQVERGFKLVLVMNRQWESMTALKQSMGAMSTD